MLATLSLLLLSTVPLDASTSTPCPAGLLHLGALQDVFSLTGQTVVQERCRAEHATSAHAHTVTLAALPVAVVSDTPMKLSLNLSMFADSAMRWPQHAPLTPSLALADTQPTLVVGNAPFVANMLHALSGRGL